MYPDAETQLEEMGRTLVPLGIFDDVSDSIFMAIALHLPIAIGDTDYITVRKSICDWAINHLHEYHEKYGMGEEGARKMAMFIAMRKEGSWIESLAPAICRVTAKMYDRKVIVVRDYKRPWYFPYNDRRPVTQNDIVMVQKIHSTGRCEGESYYLWTRHGRKSK